MLVAVSGRAWVRPRTGFHFRRYGSRSFDAAMIADGSFFARLELILMMARDVSAHSPSIMIDRRGEK